MKIALRNAANRPVVIIWNMIAKGVPYKPQSDYEFLDQKRKRKVQEVSKLIRKFDIKTDELGLQIIGL